MSEEQLVRKSMNDRLQIAIDSRRANLIDAQQFADLQYQIQMEKAAKLEELAIVEDEKLGERRETELQNFADYLNKRLGVEQEYTDLAVGVEKFLTDFTTSSTKDKFSTILGLTQQFTQKGSKESKKQFELNKKASLGLGALALAESVMTSFQKGSEVGGPYVGAAFAAVAGIAQAVNLAKIKSASFGGGGGGGGGAGGGGVAAVSTSAGNTNLANTSSGASSVQPQRSVSIAVQGDRIGRDSIIELIEQINEAIGDGASLAVAG